VLSRATVKAALEHARQSGEWTIFAIQGLYYELWQQEFKVEVTFAASLKQDHRLVELLVQCVGLNSAAECVEALFKSEDLKWVKSKNLDFLTDASKLTRWVIPAARHMKAARANKPEWRRENDATSAGVVINPLRNRK
jgi:hypothetical protein